MAMSRVGYISDFTCTTFKYKFWKETGKMVYDDEEDIHGKIAIVTGSNSGIGKEIALQLARRGATVIIAVRNFQRGKEALEDIQEKIGKDKKLELMKVDLSDLQSIRDFVQEFQAKYSHLDILVNNAGVLDNTGVLKISKDGFEQQIAINHLGPFLLTKLLLDSLKNGISSRIICVQSGNLAVAPFDLEVLSSDEPILRTGSMKSEQYNVAKLFNAICMVKLAKSLECQGIKLFNLCPGFVKTPAVALVSSNMNTLMSAMYRATQEIMAITPHQSSETLVYLSTSRSLAAQEETGKGEIYRFMKIWERGNKILMDYVHNNEESETLYKVTNQLVGLQ